VQKTTSPFSQLRKLTHKYIDIDGFDEYENLVRKFQILLTELANDLLVNPKLYRRSSGYSSRKYGKMLRILALNLHKRDRLRIIREFRHFLLSLDVSDRLKLLQKLDHFIIMMTFGKETQFFADIDKFDGKDKKQRDEKHYPYIPYRTSGFIKLLRLLHELGDRRSFIDVGCGIGDKVLLAWMSGIFEECVGVEYEGFTAGVGKSATSELWDNYSGINLKGTEIVSKSWNGDNVPIEIGIIQANAFDISYRRFDTIYLYHPIIVESLMSNLYSYIFKLMSPKSILIEVMIDRGLDKAVSKYNKEAYSFPLTTRYNTLYFYKTTTNKIRQREFSGRF
jgi:hypothetical protein